MSEDKELSLWAKFMAKNWMIGSVRVYLWPFVFVAVVSVAMPLIDKFLIG